jgi:hypothetical protein
MNLLLDHPSESKIIISLQNKNYRKKEIVRGKKMNKNGNGDKTKDKYKQME